MIICKSFYIYFYIWESLYIIKFSNYANEICILTYKYFKHILINFQNKMFLTFVCIFLMYIRVFLFISITFRCSVMCNITTWHAVLFSRNASFWIEVNFLYKKEKNIENSMRLSSLLFKDIISLFYTCQLKIKKFFFWFFCIEIFLITYEKTY